MLSKVSSTAQDDWDDYMVGKERRVTVECRNCQRAVTGRLLDNNIFRFKCMMCGAQWHEKVSN